MGVSVGYKNKTVERGSLLSGNKKREEESYERNGGISGQNNFAIIKISSNEVLFLLFIWMERGRLVRLLLLLCSVAVEWGQ